MSEVRSGERPGLVVPCSGSGYRPAKGLYFGQTLASNKSWIQSGNSREDRAIPAEAHSDPAEVIQAHGVQVTAQRLAVMRAVADPPHGTTDDIATTVRAGIGTISRQAVYDSLGVLSERGLIRRIQPAGSPARYEDRVDDNHHHLICRSCGGTVDYGHYGPFFIRMHGTRPAPTASPTAGAAGALARSASPRSTAGPTM